MKQSTKLLCLVLSLIMAFSCFSVIGSAGLTEGGVAYDRVDDAALTNIRYLFSVYLLRTRIFVLAY